MAKTHDFASETASFSEKRARTDELAHFRTRKRRTVVFFRRSRSASMWTSLLWPRVQVVTPKRLTGNCAGNCARELCLAEIVPGTIRGCNGGLNNELRRHESKAGARGHCGSGFPEIAEIVPGTIRACNTLRNRDLRRYESQGGRLGGCGDGVLI